MEKPYSGLTARVQLNGVTIGYINSLELNLEKEVLLVGKIKDRIELASIYKRADLFLFPLYCVLKY